MHAAAPGGAHRARTLRRHERGGERGAHALGPVVVDQETRLAVNDRLGQCADASCDDQTPCRHRLERRPARLVGACGHQREAVGRREDQREITIAVAGEDDLVPEPELGDEPLEIPARLPFADEEQPRGRELPEEQPEARQQEVVPAVRRQTRDRDDHRRVAELELVAHGPRVDHGGEALERHRARDPVDAARRDADLATTCLDLARDREGRGGAPVEPGREPVAFHGAEVVERPHDVRTPAIREDRTRDQREPVVVRVMGVDDVDPLATDRGTQAKRVAGDCARSQRESLHELEARLPRLRLESVARDHAETDTVAARPQAGHELDRRVRAARPPAVGRQVQDSERRHARSARSASRRSMTAVASIARMHG